MASIEISRKRCIATRRQVIQDVTRRQGFASRCGRCADTGPGARVISCVLAAAGKCGVGSFRIASSAAAVARLAQACLMLLEAAVVAAFSALDRCSALRGVAALLMPQGSKSRAVKNQEERSASHVSPGA